VRDRGESGIMSSMNSPAGWGPSHQTGRSGARAVVMVALLVAALVVGVSVWVFIAAAALLLGLQVLGVLRDRRSAKSGGLPTGVEDPLAALKELAGASGGIYLGREDSGQFRCSRSERAVLLIGAPRSGKTSAVIIPALIAHDGPAVSTSTKLDLAAATWPARHRSSRLWVFDPTGSSAPRGFEQLRWSPVRCAKAWDGALLMARAMTAAAGVGEGTTHGTHWVKRSQALLGPLLHAAALDGRDMESVVDWVMRHELDEPGTVLELETASRLAFASLLGILNTEERERASIFSAAADALVAYTSEAALEAAKDPNFDPDHFVATSDTIYIHAPAEEQAAAAPLVCGLLAEVRRATYLAHRNGTLNRRVLFALDEAANIAPLQELPAIASEGGGQGLTLLAAFQDLSQARARWGQAADGFLTLFGTKLILSGIADTKTLDAVSVALGEYDRKMVARTTGSSGERSTRTKTVSTQRTRVLSPGEVANIPAGRGLHLDGLAWELLTLTPGLRRRAVEDAHHTADRPGVVSTNGPRPGRWRADICGRLAPSTASAWSVCLLPLTFELLVAPAERPAC
jgi:type IV secretion system protein VirD4